MLHATVALSFAALALVSASHVELLHENGRINFGEEKDVALERTGPNTLTVHGNLEIAGKLNVDSPLLTGALASIERNIEQLDTVSHWLQLATPNTLNCMVGNSGCDPLFNGDLNDGIDLNAERAPVDMLVEGPAQLPQLSVHYQGYQNAMAFRYKTNGNVASLDLIYGSTPTVINMPVTTPLDDWILAIPDFGMNGNGFNNAQFRFNPIDPDQPSFLYAFHSYVTPQTLAA